MSEIIVYDFPQDKGRGPRVTFQNWIQKLREVYSRSYPRVVAQGEYPLIGVREKLRASKRIFRELCERRLLEIDSENSRPTQKCVAPISLARTISAVFKRPLEEILIDSVQYSVESNQTPEEHVKLLWNAYGGERWFEWYRMHAREKFSGFSPLRSWQVISTGMLSGILKVSQATVREIMDHGFIVPHSGHFVLRSLHNRVHVKALAQFVSLLTDKRVQQLYIEADHDSYFQDVIAGFINRRVLPYLKKRELSHKRLYTLSELHEKLGVRENTLRSYIFTTKNLPYSRVQDGRRKRVAVQGIDIVLHQLKGERKKHYTGREVTDLLGLAESHLERLRLPPERNGGYGTQQWIYPLYDTIAAEARKRFI